MLFGGWRGLVTSILLILWGFCKILTEIKKKIFISNNFIANKYAIEKYAYFCRKIDFLPLPSGLETLIHQALAPMQEGLNSGICALNIMAHYLSTAAGQGLLQNTKLQTQD
jgi:hypothetical protein